jgi:Leu/Phe-tRNA-protein transferase
MHRIGGKLMDCQLETPHLKSMGGLCIPYEDYLEILNPEGLKHLRSLPEESEDTFDDSMGEGQ